MLFSDPTFAVLTWLAMLLTSFFTSYWLAQSDNPVKLFFIEKDIFGCVKLIGLVSIQIIVLIILILNWCNAAIVTLVGYILAFIIIYRGEGNDDLMGPICGIAVISLIAGLLIVTYTQSYLSANKQIDSHKILFYQIKDAYEYGNHYNLWHNYTIMYVCEDPEYSGEIGLNGKGATSVRFCIDPENPRIEEITYTQELIEHVITGGTISLGSKETLKEIVFYLPNTDFLASPPALPDE